MTQPSAVNQSFDTSLVDVQKSFSSTETNTSASDGKENVPPAAQTQGRVPSPYQTVSTDVLYDQWAASYDTDGNVLQAIDDIQLHTLLPDFVGLTSRNLKASGDDSQAIRILDLGCGTGRNTVKLLQSSWQREVDVSGWDSSRAMLEIASTKCEAALKDQRRGVGIELEQVDIADPTNVASRFSKHFNGLISTLVLEHIAIDDFFSIVAHVLNPGSFALITNMHQDMGALSRAGYKTATGERFKATSYIYTVAETVDAARNVGLELVGDVTEMAVPEELIEGGIVNGINIEKGQVTERARKWIGTKIWYGMMLRKT